MEISRLEALIYSFDGHAVAAFRVDAEQRAHDGGASFGGFHFVGNLGEEAADADVAVHADDGVDGAGHAEVGEVAGTFWKGAFVGGGYVGMGAGNDGGAAIEVPGEGFFFFVGFGVEIDDDEGLGVFAGGVGEDLVGFCEGAVDVVQFAAALEVYNEPFEAAGSAACSGGGRQAGGALPFYVRDAPAGQAAGVVGGSQQCGLGFEHIGGFLALPYVVAACDDIDTIGAHCIYFFLADAKAFEGILAIRDDEVGFGLFYQRGQKREKRPEAGRSHDIADHEDICGTRTHRAYSTMRVSLMMVTLILPG